MGLAKLKRLLIEDITRAFTTREIQLFVNEIDGIDLYKLTGFPENVNIPRKEAAIQIVDYFHRSNKILRFLTGYIHLNKYGFKGEKLCFNNYGQIIKEMEDNGYKYAENVKKVVSVTDLQKEKGWGFLEDGKIYNFAFVSVDICSNSRLIKTYDPEIVRKTYTNFKAFTNTFARSRNGIIWSWEGDGGLIAFHIGDQINDATLFSIDLLESMVIFNTTSNLIEQESINIRIAINAGNAEYKKSVETIQSEAIQKVKEIEKYYTDPLSISMNQNSFQHVNRNLRDYFQVVTKGSENFYQYQCSLKVDK